MKKIIVYNIYIFNNAILIELNNYLGTCLGVLVSPRSSPIYDISVTFTVEVSIRSAVNKAILKYY